MTLPFDPWKQASAELKGASRPSLTARLMGDPSARFARAPTPEERAWAERAQPRVPATPDVFKVRRIRADSVGMVRQ